MSNRKILIISPDMAGGSYLSTLYSIEQSGLLQSTALITLKKIKERSRGLPVVGFNWYLDYRSIGPIMARNPLVSLIYNLPLYIITPMALAIFRPKVVISNGFLSGLMALLLAPALKIRFVLFHHGQFEFYIKPSILRFLKNGISKSIDFAVANSIGSKLDLANLIEENRILIIEPYVRKSFFNLRDRMKIRIDFGLKDELVVFYAGWLNKEKRCDKLLSLAQDYPQVHKVIFWFAGDGELRDDIIKLSANRPNVKYLGYIKDVEEIATRYTAADVSWSVAETTYLARPAAESLACGTPVIIPKSPGVLRRAEAGIKVPQSIVPSNIGWLVDDENISELSNLINDLVQRRVANHMRTQCRSYAQLQSRTNNTAKLGTLLKMRAKI